MKCVVPLKLNVRGKIAAIRRKILCGGEQGKRTGDGCSFCKQFTEANVMPFKGVER